MIVKPIPKRLLNDSAVLKKVTSTDIFGTKTFSLTQLSRVRIETAHKLILTDGNTVRKKAATLYFDAANSLPTGVEIATGDYIGYGDEEYLTESVRRVISGGKLHHIKISMLCER